MVNLISNHRTMWHLECRSFTSNNVLKLNVDQLVDLCQKTPKHQHKQSHVASLLKSARIHKTQFTFLFHSMQLKWTKDKEDVREEFLILFKIYHVVSLLHLVHAACWRKRTFLGVYIPRKVSTAPKWRVVQAESPLELRHVQRFHEGASLFKLKPVWSIVSSQGWMLLSYSSLSSLLQKKKKTAMGDHSFWICTCWVERTSYPFYVLNLQPSAGGTTFHSASMGEPQQLWWLHWLLV